MSLPLSATLGEFVAADGTRLTTYTWSTPKEPTRGWAHVVHGLGEHAGRYEALAQTLLAQGFSVRAHDHRGHGRSQGRRGVLPHTQALIEDTRAVLQHTRDHAQPLVLLGHSMGGLVAAALVAQTPSMVDGLVLSSPALALDLTWPERQLVALLMRCAPNLTVSNGLHPERLTHDPGAVAAYVNDPLVHSRVSARLIRGMTDNAPHVWDAAPQWRTPTLLMFAGDDALVSPAGSRRLTQLLPPEVLEAHEFKGLYHEIFNELEAEVVMGTLTQWLSARWPSSGP
jgi:alpha-beta hydrolase superfamily lysophospholipase